MIGSKEILDFSFFVNREKGRPCLVAGGAPSIKNFPYDRFDGVAILMNEGPRMLKDKIKPDYWMCANFGYPEPQQYSADINAQSQGVFIFCDTSMYGLRNTYSHQFLVDNLNVPWFAFDERHFDGKKCDPSKRCCQLVDVYPERKTIFEFIRDHFGENELPPLPNTAAFFSFAFAVMMGCSPIYIQGIELPTYMKNCDHYRMFRSLMLRDVYWIMKARIKELLFKKKQFSPFYEGISDTLDAFAYLTEICHRQGIEVFNLSKTSKLNDISILPYLDPKDVV